MEPQAKAPLAKRIWDGLRSLEEHIERYPGEAREQRLKKLERR